jgi:hypothetical protein
LKCTNEGLIDWTSREAIRGLKGLKYNQLKEAFNITPNMEMEYKVSEKSVFPYPGLSYDEYVRKMEDSWPEIVEEY